MRVRNVCKCFLKIWPLNKFMQFLFMHFCQSSIFNLVVCMELHSSEGKGDRGKRTSDRARTRDLVRSIAEFQPREPWRPVEILRPPLLLCISYRCATIQAGTVCYVMVACSATPSTMHEFASLRWKATSISLYVRVFVSWCNL